MMPIFLVYNKDAGKMYGPVTLVEILRAEHDNGVCEGAIGMPQYGVDSNEYDHLEFYQYTGWDDADENMVFEGHMLDMSSIGHVFADDMYVVTSVNSFANYRGYDTNGWEEHAGDIRIARHGTGAKNTLHNWSHYFGVE